MKNLMMNREINMLNKNIIGNNKQQTTLIDGMTIERGIHICDLFVKALTNVSATNLNFYKLKFTDKNTVNHIIDLARVVYDDCLYNNSIIITNDFIENSNNYLYDFFRYIVDLEFEREYYADDNFALLIKYLICINSSSEQRDFIYKINGCHNEETDYYLFKYHFDYLIIDKNKDIGFINDYNYKYNYGLIGSRSDTFIIKDDMINHGISNFINIINDYLIDYSTYDFIDCGFL